MPAKSWSIRIGPLASKFSRPVAARKMEMCVWTRVSNENVCCSGRSDKSAQSVTGERLAEKLESAQFCFENMPEHVFHYEEAEVEVQYKCHGYEAQRTIAL
jgi:hypothetical protein